MSVALVCLLVLKTHSVKGHSCQVTKALSKEELSRVKTGQCCIISVHLVI